VLAKHSAAHRAVELENAIDELRAGDFEARPTQKPLRRAVSLR
jgi:hypothetical protein